ncbi:MAG: hypothetical protein WCW56_03570 [Candidatus Paceibacterota bacterium]|jgi:hypothetical protein
MNESIPNPDEIKKIEKARIAQEMISLAESLSRSQEAFPFYGIEQVAYLKMRETDENYPGYTTPIDELIERLKEKGLKIVLGPHPESGNIFVLPADSDDIDRDSLSPYKLQVGEGMNDELKQLISASLAYYDLANRE